MIILDTNVVSEAARTVPDERVIRWWQAQPPHRLFATTITRAELLYGIGLLPEGKRKDMTCRMVAAIFSKGLNSRVLGFDEDAADAYAHIAASRRRMGKPIGQFDGLIAAITQSRRARLATRNTKDFVDCGIELVNPWE